MNEHLSTVRLGVVGAGSVTATYHLPVLQGMDHIAVRWVVDVDPARAASVARSFHVPEHGSDLGQRSDVDAVLIATPVGVRRRIMEAVFDARWHALLEKPFASTTAEHQWMLAEAKRVDVHLGVGLVRRFYVSTRRAHDVIRSALLGEVTEVLAGEGLRARKFGRGGDWYQSSQAAGGGVFFETGSHLVDQVLAITRAQSCAIEHCERTAPGGLEMETIVRGTLEIRGRSVPLRLAVSRLRDIYNGIVVRCQTGEIRLGLDGAAVVELWGLDKNRIGDLGGYPDPKTAIYAALRAEWQDFIERSKAPPHDAWDTGLLTTQILETCATWHERSHGLPRVELST